MKTSRFLMAVLFFYRTHFVTIQKFLGIIYEYKWKKFLTKQLASANL